MRGYGRGDNVAAAALSSGSGVGRGDERSVISLAFLAGGLGDWPVVLIAMLVGVAAESEKNISSVVGHSCFPTVGIGGGIVCLSQPKRPCDEECSISQYTGRVMLSLFSSGSSGW